MAKKATVSTDATTGAPIQKKTRARKAKYFVAHIDGASDPVIVIAKNLKTALNAVITIREAVAADLIAAGKQEHRVIDTQKATEIVS